MRDKIFIICARSVFILGILVFALAVFLFNYNQFALNSLKARKSLMDMELQEKYKITVPPKPVDFSAQLPKPVEPPESADTWEKEQYYKALKEYDAQKTRDQEAYAAAQKEYEQFMRQLDYKRKLNAYHKSKETYNMNLTKNEIDRQIKLQETAAAIVTDKYIIQLIGTILILIGAVGILIFGENWERVAVIVFLGFAFRTIVGL